MNSSKRQEMKNAIHQLAAEFSAMSKVMHGDPTKDMKEEYRFFKD